MAKAKKTKKGKVVGSVNRQPGNLYFVDGNGNVRETKLNRKGRKRGSKNCGH